jgi:hypothetical protein
MERWNFRLLIADCFSLKSEISHLLCVLRALRGSKYFSLQKGKAE